MPEHDIPAARALLGDIADSLRADQAHLDQTLWIAGFPPAAWPSDSASAGHRPVGMPVPSTAPLTNTERGALDGIALAVDGLAHRLRDAINRNRIDLALEALAHAGHIGDVARRFAIKVGRNR